MMCVLIWFLNLICIMNCVNILGVFFAPSVSHQIVFQPIWKELSIRGHQVTVLTPKPLRDPQLINLTEIDLEFTYSILRKYDYTDMSKDRSMLSVVLFVEKVYSEILEAGFAHPKVQELINDDTRTYDLILVECLHPLVYAWAAKYRVPVIAVSSLGVFLQTHDAVGNPTHPVLNPDICINFLGKPSFYDRFSSTFYNLWYRLYHQWYVLSKSNRIARKYFGNNMPDIGELERNVSLVLVNSNPILHTVRPNVPTIIEMGQMHIKPKNPLPNDLETFLNDNPNGVIYISMGSNINSSSLPTETRRVIIEAISELPYKILWKWETDELPDKPANVITRKWLPQQDILGHPNVKLFITQGGLQSMEESITNAVPLVGMPFYGDQSLNVAKMVELGIGLSIDLNKVTKNELKSAALQVITNERFKNRITEIKQLLEDQPMKGLEKAIWWIEYVLRHKGTKHLRSPALDLPWYQYFLLDVIFATVFLMFTLFYIIWTLFRILVKGKSKEKIN